MIRGTVAKTYTKDWKADDGTVVLHSFQLQGDKRYFRTGTDRLVAEGDYITFDVEGNNNVVAYTLEKGKVKTVQAPPAEPTASGRPAPKWGGGFNKPKSSENFEARAQYWENKEKRDIEVIEPRITFSAAQRDAIEVVRAALDKDLLAFGNASKGAKLDMLLNFVDEVTARFYAQRMDAAAVGSAMIASASEDEGTEEESDDE